MNKSYIIIIAVLIIVLPLAWYLLSPLFLDKEVDEPQPVSSSSSGSNQQTEPITNIEETDIPSHSISYQGNFVGADSFHQVEGEAIIFTQDGKTYLRFENFKSTNGPDLKVYLSEDTSANSYSSLGELKGNIGSQNYEIPPGTDLEKYDNVLIWCEKFSVLFGYADIS